MYPLVVPTTKTDALCALGVADGEERQRVAALVDFANVDQGELLIGPRTPLPTVYVGLSGSIALVDNRGLATWVEAPFVLDLWADEFVASGESTVVVASRVTVLMIDWTARETVFEAVPSLRILSVDTERRLRWRSMPLVG